MKNVFLGLTLCATLLAQTKTAVPAAATTKSTARKSTAPVRPAAKSVAVKPNIMDPATLKATAPPIFRAQLNTNKGPVVIEVTRAWSPLGADRFYNLVRGGFFTDMYFFRVVGGFMAQFGMSSKPEVSAKWAGQTIQDDPPGGINNTRGMVTFAKSGMPNSRSTQFFINYGDNSRLDAMGFTPFGKVTEGMDVIDKLYSGYGEGSNDQEAIRAQGKVFFDKYPMLDKILTASIVFPVSAATPAPATRPIGASGAIRPRAASAHAATGRTTVLAINPKTGGILAVAHAATGRANAASGKK